MTPEERSEMEQLCRRITEEKDDPRKLELLLRELNDFLNKKIGPQNEAAS